MQESFLQKPVLEFCGWQVRERKDIYFEMAFCTDALSCIAVRVQYVVVACVSLFGCISFDNRHDIKNGDTSRSIV